MNAAAVRGQVENVLSRYAWAYDMNELDELEECFAAGAECTFRGSGLKVGRQAVVAELRLRRAGYPAGTTPWHVITNVRVDDPRDGEAVVRSSFTFFRQDPGSAPLLVGIGWYDDVFVTEGGAWRVKRRVIRSPG